MVTCISICIFKLIFWLCWVFVAVCRLFVVVEHWGYSPPVSFSLQWLLLCSPGSRVLGLNNYGAQAQLPHGMWILPRPGIESVSPHWLILNHWTNREALQGILIRRNISTTLEWSGACIYTEFLCDHHECKRIRCVLATQMSQAIIGIDAVFCKNEYLFAKFQSKQS